MSHKFSFQMADIGIKHKLGSVIPDQPIAKNMKLWQLNNMQCHWPLDGPTGAEKLFCGCQIKLGKRYCEYHWHISIETERK